MTATSRLEDADSGSPFSTATEPVQAVAADDHRDRFQVWVASSYLRQVS